MSIRHGLCDIVPRCVEDRWVWYHAEKALVAYKKEIFSAMIFGVVYLGGVGKREQIS